MKRITLADRQCLPGVPLNMSAQRSRQIFFQDTPSIHGIGRHDKKISLFAAINLALKLAPQAALLFASAESMPIKQKQIATWTRSNRQT